MPKLKTSKSKTKRARARQVLDRRGRPLTRFNARDIGRGVTKLWGQVRKHRAVAITRDGKPVAVMVSAEGFLELLFPPSKGRATKNSRRR
jgi:hypothetical protein